MLYTSKTAKMELHDIVKAGIANNYPDSRIGESEIYASMSVPKAEFGDLSSSICLRIAKVAGTKPSDVAERIIGDGRKLLGKGYIKELKNANGYINAFFDEKRYAYDTLKSVMELKGNYGLSMMGNGKRVMIEFPSVNPNKAWHIGHLLNALIGDSISNILSACGYSVERENYIDDLGIQVAQSLWGYLNLGNKPDKKFDTWLGEQYVSVNRMLSDEKVKKEIDALMKKMEEGGNEDAVKARELAERCVKANIETASAYRIYHDVMMWESDIVRTGMLSKAMNIAIEKGAASRSDDGKYAGCIIVDLKKLKGIAKDFDNPNEESKVLIRSNGTATYVAKDLAFHMWKLGILKGDFKYSRFLESQYNGKPLYTTGSSGEDMQFGGAEIAINIIGSEQRYPQLILKSMFSLMGMNELAEKLIHVAYGEISLKGGTLSGRSGGWMGSDHVYTADALLADAKEKVIEKAKESKRKVDAADVADSVAVGAIRFAFLKTNPEKKIVFSWDDALSFDGNSGPYCMYTYARANSILDRANVSSLTINEIDFSAVERKYDFELIKAMGRAQEVVEKAATEYRPDIIAEYLIELSSGFSKFYESTKVIGSGDAEGYRIAIVMALMQVLGNFMKLLGMEPVAKM